MGSYCPFPVFALAIAHVAFQFVDRRRLSPAYNIERDGLVGVATEASDFKIAVTSIERIAESRRRLSWSLVPEHALVPGFTGEPISLLARLGCPLR